MTSTFFGLTVSLRALMAQRKAIDVTAHNVANANAEGYTRQEAVMRASTPFPIPVGSREIAAGQMGTGVDVASIRRIRDQFLDSQIREQSWRLGNAEVRRDYLQQVETVFNEPSSSGINALMNKMWAAWHDLSNNPESYIAKASVAQTSTVLTDAIRRSTEQLDTMRDGASQEISTGLSEANSLVREIQDLGKQIVAVEIANDQENDLADRRDLLLDKLSRIVQIGYQEKPDGSMQVWLGSPRNGAPGSADALLVSPGGDPATLAWNANKTAGTFSVTLTSGGATTDVTSLVTGGEIRGLVELWNDDLDPTYPTGVAGRLEALANGLRTQVNQALGGIRFLEGTEASDIGVSVTYLSNPELIPAGSSGAVGDGALALAVAQLQNKQVTIGGKTVTIGAWYQEMVSTLGIEARQAAATATNQGLLVDHLTTSRESLSGVSLDEEAANLVRFQRAYEAAARTMTAMDEMLDKLINGTGIVGR